MIAAPRRSSLAHTDDLPLAVLPVKPTMYGNVVSCNIYKNQILTLLNAKDRPLKADAGVLSSR